MQTLRKWQEDYLDDAVRIIKEKGTLFLSAPTGAGKTLFSLLIAKKLGVPALFLTRTHAEFEAIARDAKKLQLTVSYFFGKPRVCPFADEETDYEDIDCRKCQLMKKINLNIIPKPPSEIIRNSTTREYCTYQSLRHIANHVDVLAATYYYYFNPVLRELIPEKFVHNLVIVDEAHNLLSSDSWFQRQLTDRAVGLAIREIMSVNKNEEYTDAIAFLNNLHAFLSSLKNISSCKEVTQAPFPDIEIMKDLNGALMQYLSIRNQQVVKSYIRSVIRFFGTSGRVFQCDRRLVIVPSNAFEIVKKALEIAPRKILMSGTLPDFNINGGRINVELQMGNSKYMYCDSLTSMFSLREKMAKKYAEYIANVYNNTGRNIIVYFPSYAFMGMVLDYLDTPTLIESKGMTHEDFLEQMKGGKYVVALVMNAKESEGVEFRDYAYNKNLFEHLILAGLPHPDMTDDMVQFRIQQLMSFLKKDKEKVIKEMIEITVKQTIGRALRSPEDKVIIHLCDWRYRKFFNEENDQTNDNR